MAIPTRYRGESGESLAELIVTIAVMSVGVVGIVGAIAMAAMTSTINREQGAAENALRSYAEFIQSEPFDCVGTYQSLTFQSTGERDPSGQFVASAVAVPLPSATPCRLQQLRISVRSTANHTATPIELTLDVVKRKTL